jgi:rhamnosyltransferase
MVVFFSILYNPDINAIENIKIAKSVGLIPVVYLNSIDISTLNCLNELDVVLLGDNRNVGIGVAFYDLETYLNSLDYKYFVYFDQDTKVSHSAWLNILETYEIQYSVGSVGLLHYSGTVGVTPKLVISSGCLFSMKILNEIGFHDKSYFVEGVDYEFCLRLKLNNLDIVNIYSEGIDHESLQDGFSRRFLTFTIPLRIYNKNRMKDFNRSHRRLLFLSLENRLFGFSFFFLKSYLKQNIMEKISTLLKV